MTITELIAKLSTMPQDAEAFVCQHEYGDLESVDPTLVDPTDSCVPYEVTLPNGYKRRVTRPFVIINE